jgi:hypothetical protein
VLLLVAAQVQGDSAPASLVSAFRKVERYAAARIAAGQPDEAPAVTILARGGGSLEDLWAFNDEAVVRAVVAHSVPVVCGVGHEWTSPSPISRLTFAARRHRPLPRWSSRIGPSSWPRSVVAGDGWMARSPLSCGPPDERSSPNVERSTG